MRGDAVLTLLTKVDVEGEGKLNDLGRTLSSTGTKLTAGLTVPILAAGAAVVKLAGDAAVSQAKLEATFNSMGAEAWTTVEALGAQAEKLDAMSSAFDDDAVTDFQAVLLTFGNVTGEVFDRAATAGVNMSEALGTDLQSAAIQLGKALNDPVAGLTALSRVGVSFTEQQKAQIRTMTEAGDIAGAQGIILGELERQFGGVSAAIAATPTGQFQEGMQQIQNAGESLGTILLPILSAAAGALAKVAEWFKALSPATQEWIVKIGLVVAAIGPALLIGGKLVGAFGAISKAFKAMSLLMSTNPWLLLIAAVIALVVLIVANWDKITAALKKAWDWITETAGKVGKWITDAFKKAVDFLVDLFLNFTPLGLIIKNFDKIKEAVTGVWEWIKTTFGKVLDFFKSIPGKIGEFFAGLGEAIVSPFKSAFNAVAGFWNRTVGRLSFTVPDWVPLIGGKGWSAPQIPTLGQGGIVTGPTLALLGEAGPEAVIPLDRRQGPAAIQINIDAGVGADPVAIGQRVVEAIRAYERSSGTAWRLGETG